MLKRILKNALCLFDLDHVKRGKIMKKYKVVYVVTCNEGCYSDQRFWVECCFVDKDKAIKFKELKDREEIKKREDEDVPEWDERKYSVTKTIVIGGSIDLEAININNIFDYLGFPGNEDIDVKEENQENQYIKIAPGYLKITDIDRAQHQNCKTCGDKLDKVDLLRGYGICNECLINKELSHED